MLELRGGGCIEEQVGVAVIRADGVLIRAYDHVKSSDFDGVSGNGQLTIADLVAFSNEYCGPPSGCHDYDNDGVTGLADFLIFHPAFTGSAHRP